MKPKPTVHSLPRTIAVVALFSLSVAITAVAGPPLICHPFDIGDARSLPWTGNAWNLAGNPNYDTRSLARDTLAILDANPLVIVRMETLRRATLYAHKDLVAAKELLTRLHARATQAENSGHPDALAWFDFGYLAASYNEWIKDQNPAAGIDGYSFVSKALALRGSDPEMEFAAALISQHGAERDRLEHWQKAVAGSKTDVLLARNLASHSMGNEKQADLVAPGKNILAEGAKK